MKITIEAEDGDSTVRYDLVSFSFPVESVDDWACAIRTVASVSDWVQPMILLEAVIDADLSQMHVGWWAKENKDALISFRDNLTIVIQELDKCTESK
jgi:hypothetical protein